MLFQLPKFRAKHPVKSVKEVAQHIVNMQPEVKGKYNQVDVTVCMLMVCPASSAETERSFSVLRRLKNWLRSTMSQTQLNSVAVYHIHKHKLDELRWDDILTSFVNKFSAHRKLFGH